MNIHLQPHLDRLWDRLHWLGEVSDNAEGLTRTFLSPAMRRANALVGKWLREAGAETRVDDAGNLVGSFAAGPGAAEQRKRLLMGSHLDTVRNAGKFDGPLGVLLPLAAVEALAAAEVELPFPVDVLGFSDEEGVRFHSTYLGSKAVAGTLTGADLDRADAEGVTVREALRVFNSLTERYEAPGPAYRAEDLLGYVEAHIEQGPALEAEGLALGVVSAIAGQLRARMEVTGQAGHAGTVPMELRKDALAGAAELILAVETEGRRTPGLVATVGSSETRPGAANVIPAQVRMTLDVRHARDGEVRAAAGRIRARGEEICAERKLTLEWETLMEAEAAPCDGGLTRRLAEAVRRVQGRCPVLASGAGHDAAVLAGLCPVAMLFVRCREGLSHHPDEFASKEDIGVALAALVDFLQQWGGGETEATFGV